MGKELYISWQILYSSTLVITLFNSNASCFKLKLLLYHSKAVFLYTLCHSYGTPTFKAEALRLVSNVQQLKCLLLLYEQLICRALP